MSQLFTTILYQPLLNLLVFFYTVVPGPDIGVAIVLLTMVIKLLLYPLSRQSIRGQKSLQQLQPKMNELKERYKNDREAQAKAMMALYKAEKVNPLSSCLPLLIQLPILLAVFQVFQSGLHHGSPDPLSPFGAAPRRPRQPHPGFIRAGQPGPTQPRAGALSRRSPVLAGPDALHGPAAQENARRQRRRHDDDDEPADALRHARDDGIYRHDVARRFGPLLVYHYLAHRATAAGNVSQRRAASSEDDSRCPGDERIVTL